MKKQVAKTKNAILFLDNGNSLIIQEWTNSDGTMNDEEFKIDMLNFLKYVEEYNTQKALIDTKYIGNVIAPEVQNWIDKNITVKTNKIIDKIAFILPTDIFEKVSIEQTMSEKEGLGYSHVKYFSTEEVAVEWLMI